MSDTLLLALGGLMLFSATALTLSIIGVATTERRGVARSLAASTVHPRFSRMSWSAPLPNASSHRSVSGW